MRAIQETTDQRRNCYGLLQPGFRKSVLLPQSRLKVDLTLLLKHVRGPDGIVTNCGSLENVQILSFHGPSATWGLTDIQHPSPWKKPVKTHLLTLLLARMLFACPSL